MHGSRGVESALTLDLGALSLLLGPCYPNRLRPGPANKALAPAPLHHCFAAAQANLGNEAKHVGVFNAHRGWRLTATLAVHAAGEEGKATSRVSHNTSP